MGSTQFPFQKMAENPKIKEGTKEFEIFAEALHEVNETLAKKMAGEEKAPQHCSK